MQIRHLKGCTRISASSSRILPLSASTTGASESLLASLAPLLWGEVDDEALCSSRSASSDEGICDVELGLGRGSVFTSTCCNCVEPLGDMTASRNASRSFCSRAEPSSRGVITSASLYCEGPNWSSPSTTRSTSSSSWAASACLLPRLLLDEEARPVAVALTIQRFFQNWVVMGYFKQCQESLDELAS